MGWCCGRDLESRRRRQQGRNPYQPGPTQHAEGHRQTIGIQVTAHPSHRIACTGSTQQRHCSAARSSLALVIAILQLGAELALLLAQLPFATEDVGWDSSLWPMFIVDSIHNRCILLLSSFLTISYRHPSRITPHAGPPPNAPTNVRAARFLTFLPSVACVAADPATFSTRTTSSSLLSA